jgi:hypothetical protein
LDSSRTTLPPGYPVDTTTNPNNTSLSSAALVRQQQGIGPGMILKVMAGDQSQYPGDELV